MSLAHKALLASLTISQWTGRKLDKTATGTVETTHATEKRVGNYTKKLLPGAKELEEIARIAGAIRQYFYDQTAPWHADGARMIKAQSYMEFCHEFQRMRCEYEAAVSAFIA